MKPRRQKALKTLAILIAFSLAQIYVSAALPEPTPGGVPQQPLTARLITKNNQPISVNGNSVGTGATILTGATIETPEQVSAVIDLGSAGLVEVTPGSQIKIDFDANGNVRVKVVRGCAMSKKEKNILDNVMEVYTDTDSIKTDQNKDHAGGCIMPNGQLGSFPAGGLSPLTWTGIAVGGTIGGITIAALTRGEDTSESANPTGF
jgi:hypothetical protein